MNPTATFTASGDDNAPWLPKIPQSRKPSAVPSLLQRAMVTSTPPANARYAEVFFGIPHVCDATPMDEEPIPFALTEAAVQLSRFIEAGVRYELLPDPKYPQLAGTVDGTVVVGFATERWATVTGLIRVPGDELEDGEEPGATEERLLIIPVARIGALITTAAVAA